MSNESYWSYLKKFEETWQLTSIGSSWSYLK